MYLIDNCLLPSLVVFWVHHWSVIQLVVNLIPSPCVPTFTLTGWPFLFYQLYDLRCEEYCLHPRIQARNLAVGPLCWLPSSLWQPSPWGNRCAADISLHKWILHSCVGEQESRRIATHFVWRHWTNSNQHFILLGSTVGHEEAFEIETNLQHQHQILCSVKLSLYCEVLGCSGSEYLGCGAV